MKCILEARVVVTDATVVAAVVVVVASADPPSQQPTKIIFGTCPFVPVNKVK